MQKIPYCLKNTLLGVKNQVPEFHKYLQIFWMDFAAAIGYLEAVYIVKLLICIRNDFKVPLATDIILFLKSVTLSFKGREMKLLTLYVFC